MISVAPKIMSTNNTRKNTADSSIAKPITKIVLSKEWVLPPRPKPGRKPSEDIPNSKRKAQNRAAQRAFRERRANRVSELEEQIMEMERSWSIKEGTLNNLVKSLRAENDSLKVQINNLKNEKMKNMNNKNINNNSNNNSDASPSSRNSVDSIDSIFNFNIMPAVPLKRKNDLIQSKEIDFTNAFNNKRPKFKKMPVLNDVFMKSNNSENSFNNSSTSLNIQSISPKQSISSINNSISNSNSNSIRGSIQFESCGFCSDDTPCVCREIAENGKKDKENEEKAKQEKLEKEIEIKERELIMELTKNSNLDNLNQIIKCNGDPGTCLQCKNDPISTLFCKTVAEKTTELKLPSIQPNITTTTTNNEMLRLPSIDLLINNYDKNNLEKSFIPCADAYKTISNHLDIPKIGVSKITNNLNTKGMFVEVGSVVSCLRELDRNFSK